MFKMKVINQEVCEKLLDVKSTIEIVEEVYRLKEKQEAGVWPMVFHEFERGVADMDIKSGYLKGDADIFGLKVVSWFGENPKKDLPALIGTLLVLDSTTGVPKGILSAEHITGMRTGAAGAKYLARKDSESLLMVGAGHQSRFQIASVLAVMENIEKAVDDMNQEVAVGETETPIKKGVIEESDTVGEMGALILGNIEGRTSDDDITVYDTTGIALQDLLTAKKVLELAEEKGLGETIDI